MCPMHGSGFNEDGKMLQGPAALPLKKLTTKVSADNMIIFVN